MHNNTLLHVKIEIPDIPEKIFTGTLTLSEKSNLIELSELPYGLLSFKTIPLVYCYTKRESFTLIQCIFYKSDNHQVTYSIDELYDAKIDDDYTKAEFTGISAYITDFNNWVEPKLINYSHSNEKEKFITIELLNEQTKKYQLNDSYSIIIKKEPHFKAKKNETLIFVDSCLLLNCNQPLSRNKLFDTYYSFLNFYTLFSNKTPNTKQLSFNNDKREVNLLLKKIDTEENSYNILIHLDQIDNLQVLLTNYFCQRLSFDQIISLWESGLKSNNSEIVFLHLTQSIEVFHKLFYEDDLQIKSEIADQVVSIFGDKKKKEWTQMMRYYHFNLMLDNLGLSIKFPIERVLFLKYLRDSRNYYTHYEMKSYLWNQFELYEINQILVIWIRSLLLNKLGLPDDIIQKCINAEFNHSIEIDISKNPFSIWHKKK